MFEIEKGRGLVKQKDFRLLRQGARDYHTLFFAAAQLVEITIGEEQAIGQFHARPRDLKVFFSFESEGAVITGSPH